MKKPVALLIVLLLTFSMLSAAQLTFTGDFEFGYKLNYTDEFAVSALNPRGAEVALNAKVSHSYVTMTMNGQLNGTGTRTLAGNLSFKLDKALKSQHKIELPVGITLEAGNMTAVDSLVAYNDYFKHNYAYATTTNATGVDTSSILIDYEGYSLKLAFSPISGHTDLLTSLKYVPLKGIGISASYALKGGYYLDSNTKTPAEKGIAAASLSFDAQKVLDLPFAAALSLGGRYLVTEREGVAAGSLKLGYAGFTGYLEIASAFGGEELINSLDARITYNEAGSLVPSIYFRSNDLRYYGTITMSGGVALAYTLQTLTTSVSFDYVNGIASSTVKLYMTI